jgi:hypothetical protein
MLMEWIEKPECGCTGTYELSLDCMGPSPGTYWWVAVFVHKAKCDFSKKGRT